MAYKQSDAIKRAKSWVGRSYPAGWCQRWVVSEVFASGGVGDWDGDRAADAEDGWKAAKKKVAVASSKADTIPAGYPIYFLGGRSDHGHAAVSAGGGYMYSTDRPTYGRIGKVKITSVESVWGVKLAGYVITDGNGNTFTDAPKAPYKKPASGGALFKIATYNLALYNKRGESTFEKRRSYVVRNVAKANPDVLCVQEAGFDELPFWDAEFKTLGLVRAKGGSDGRYIYYRKTVFAYQASGVFTLKPEYKGDDKQAAWAVLRASGHDWLFSSFHLESDDGATPDAIRPKQMDSLYAQAEVLCGKRKIPASRRFHSGDTNSANLVRERVERSHGGVAASKNALKVFNYIYATFNGWVRKLKGAHIDYIFVDKSRPVEEWNQITSAASDHNLVYALIGRA